MGELDRTKRAIGVGNLDESVRKDIFNKLREAGGEIIKEKPEESATPTRNRPEVKTRSSVISRGGDEKSGSGSASSKSKSNGSKSQDSKSSKPSTPQDQLATYEKEISSLGARLSLKFKCWMGRVTPFGASEVNPGLMGELSTTFKEILMDMQITGNEIVGNAEHSPKVIQELDAINPFLVELIVMGQKLFNNSEVSELTDSHLNAPNLPVPVDSIRTPLFSIFKKLYLLYSYQDTYKKAVAKAYDILQKYDNKPTLLYNAKKKKINNHLDNLFGVFFEKLYLLILRSENKNFPLISKYMEYKLGIKNEDRPGQRTSGQKSTPDPNASPENETKEQDEEEKEKEKEEEKKEPELSKEEAYGMRLMQMYSIAKLRKKFDVKGDLAIAPDPDKAFLAYVYFKEFEEEYSFVFTTKKIVLKPIHINGSKVDFRAKLLDHYETVRLIEDHFKIYVEVLRELKTQKESPSSNYIEASKKMTQIETKRQTLSRNVRVTIKEFAEKGRDTMMELITDMKTKKEIVANMNDLINFETVEAKKRLNRKPIKQCIMECYCYLLALSNRLENGDLYGGLTEMKEEEFQKSFGVSLTPKEPETNSADEFSVPDETTSSDSTSSSTPPPTPEFSSDTPLETSAFSVSSSSDGPEFTIDSDITKNN